MSGFDKKSSWKTLTSSFIGVGGTKPGCGVGREGALTGKGRPSWRSASVGGW